MIKPIETLYLGYRFRSRLEARWAVFFETLGLDWRYEVQGYDLRDYGCCWYLPDFWIPELDAVIEIKPARQPDKEIDFRKYYALNTGLRKTLILIEGDPWPQCYTAHVFSLERCMQAYAVTKSHRSGDQQFVTAEGEAGPWIGFYCGGCCAQCGYREVVPTPERGRLVPPTATFPPLEPQSVRLMQAYRAARGARFEHGDTPQQGARKRTSWSNLDIVNTTNWPSADDPLDPLDFLFTTLPEETQ